MDTAHSSRTPSTSTPASPLKVSAGLLAWLGLCFLVASSGAFFPPGEWYAALNKPSWNPPGWLFGPVWTALYAMMGVAAWLVWREGGWRLRKVPLSVFLVQLGLNGLWSPLFFGLRRPDLAFVEILLLWAAIFTTLLSFWKVRRGAALLLIPYLVWVSFASVLNLVLWLLNT